MKKTNSESIQKDQLKVQISKTAQLEESVLSFWKKHTIFEKSLRQTKDNKPYSFFDGPPFATGMPHYGNMLGWIPKDVFGRYKTMQGYYVERVWGWDCHGLPIEQKIEEKLGLNGRKEIEEYGIEKFNQACRDAVMTYERDWEWYVDRMGRWVDFHYPYKTMDNDYIESVWWAFNRLYESGKVYQDKRISLYCPRCETPLSNFEIAMDNSYKDVTDDSAYVKFKLKDAENTYFIAWTTTPWTLYGNVALVVNPNLDYAKIKVGQEYLICAKERVPALKELLGLQKNVRIVKTILGIDLKDLAYEPLYPEAYQGPQKGFYVLTDDFVTAQDGSGIVHLAAYGEDDWRLIRQCNLPLIEHIDHKGAFSNDIDQTYKAWQGAFFKKLNKLVLEDLAQRNSLLVKLPYVHSYPHCYRCSTPLFYKAQPALFVDIQSQKQQLLQTNEAINWYPPNIKYGRFQKGLESAPDWNISRSRFWGATIPLWRCDMCSHQKVFGSIKALQKYSGLHKKIKDLHRPFIDTFTFACKQSSCEGTMTRIPDVFDVWFESGSMPYASIHYPFVRSKKKEQLKNAYTFVRHAQALSNTTGLIVSQFENSDLAPLTQEGQQQAATLATKLSKSIDIIVSSDFLRTKQTAQALSQSQSPQIKVQFDVRLREVNLGVYEGKAIDEFIADTGLTESRWVKTHDSSIETYRQVLERSLEVFNELEQNYSGQRIAIVSHGDVIAVLLAWLSGYREEYVSPVMQAQTKKSQFDLNNAEYRQIDYRIINEFEERFPADFISEYINQTRGWYYVMHVLSNLLFDKEAFKNCVNTGVVLAKDGSKMSKSKNNFPDPKGLLDNLGADALRFYFLDSPLLNSGDLNFDEKDVREVQSRIINTLLNVTNFYTTYQGKVKIQKEFKVGDHILDIWILSKTNKFVKEIQANMDAYNISKVMTEIKLFVDDLSNWYVRRSRTRFQKNESKLDFEQGVNTLHYVLATLVRCIAPIIPFTAEHIWQQIKLKSDKLSVHLESFPSINQYNQDDSNDEVLHKEMNQVRELVTLIMSAREVAKVKVKQPLQRVYINVALSLPELQDVLKDEVNVQEILFQEKIRKSSTLEVITQNGKTIGLDTHITPELQQEGWARDLVRHIQSARKEAGCKYQDYVTITFSVENKALVQEFEAPIKKEAFIKQIDYVDKLDTNQYDYMTNVTFRDSRITIGLTT